MIDVRELKDLSQHIKILYVEDDSSIRSVMSEYLKKFFKTVAVGNDGLEGLAEYKNNDFDIVITDLSMPNMSGLEMLREIKKINENQSVLITSAHNEPEYMTGAIKLGIDGYILKPFDFKQLNQELYKLVQKLSKFRENEEYKKYLQEMVEKKTSEISHLMDVQKSNYDKTLYLMVDMIEQRDTYTAGHSKRVALYCKLIAKEMGYSEEECDIIHQAGILHDVGKIATPDAVLLNPKSLNDIEYKLIQEHVEVSYKLLKDVPMFKPFAEIVYSHHERYDGAGYPRGLKGDEITPLARIMIVADAFDAMTTNRIYKARKSVDEALQEIENLAYMQFHPEVVKKATIALRDIKIDRDITQLPNTKLEEERFAYFYKDTLGDAFNQNYLDVVLMKNSYDLKFKYMSIFSLKRFSAFNKENGWKEGDKLLTGFSKILCDNCLDSIVFRVFGDDFVVLSKLELEVNTLRTLLNDFTLEFNIDYAVQVVDLSMVKINQVSQIERVQVDITQL